MASVCTRLSKCRCTKCHTTQRWSSPSVPFTYVLNIFNSPFTDLESISTTTTIKKKPLSIASFLGGIARFDKRKPDFQHGHPAGVEQGAGLAKGIVRGHPDRAPYHPTDVSAWDLNGHGALWGGRTQYRKRADVGPSD